MVPGGGGDPPGNEHLPRPRHGPALPVHVPALGRGGPRVLEHSGQACDDARAGTSALGGLDRGDCAVGLAGDRRQGQGHAAASAARRHAVTLHHRPDPQHLSAGPAEPDAADAAAGGLCLPAAGSRGPCRGARGDRGGDQGVSDPGTRLLRLPPDVAGGLATVAALLVWLLVVPLPFRTPAQAMADLAVWSRGMVFTYNAHGIAQRPYRSFSYKNQSIMALAHRLLRDVPADGEKVLSQHITKRRQGQPVRGMLADGSIDLAAMLTAPTETPRWDDQYEGVEAALKQAWRVNVAALDFRTVTAITLAAMLALSLFVVAVLPARRPAHCPHRRARVCPDHSVDRDVLSPLVQLRVRLADLPADRCPEPGVQRACPRPLANTRDRLDRLDLSHPRLGHRHAALRAGLR